MARRFQEITELYRQEIAALARADRWTAFLRSACRNYKLPFEEQVLVHAQRPDATAVLEIERWNRQFGRWVNKGATGIAVFDRDYPGRTRLKYYFDISDTHESRLSRPVPLWQVPAEQEPDVIEALENRFGALDDKGTLEEAIVSAMENAAADNMTDYLDDLQNCRDNSLLEELDELNLSVLYVNTEIKPFVPMESQQLTLFDMPAFDQPEDTPDAPLFSHPKLPQQIIDEALCVGANDEHSRLIICAYFMKDKPDNAAFLQRHYGENGAGFDFESIGKGPAHLFRYAYKSRCFSGG